MVTNKCSWKKDGRYNNGFSSKNKVLSIDPPLKSINRKEWTVWVNSKMGRPLVQRDFRKKFDALKFARAYMKKSC